MPKQASKACLSLFLVLSLLADYGISEEISEQSIAPAALEPETKSLSPESFPLLSNPEIPTTEAEAETLPPTYISVPPTSNTISDVETTDNETSSHQNNISNLSNANEPASPPYLGDPTLGTNSNRADENHISTASVSPSSVGDSVLDTRDMGNLSQENTSLPPSLTVDIPAVETKEENTTAALSSYSPNVDAPSPAIVETIPAVDASDDGSFSQENQSPATSVDAPAPETKREEDFTNQDYSTAYSPSNTESQIPETVPETNDYSSVPKTEAPTQAIQESDSTIDLTPSNDETFGFAPTTHQTILPFNYRAEDEPVEPYEEEEESWSGVNGAVAGVVVGACVIGVGGFIYQKRKNDNIRAQYTSLAKKDGV